jgi:hypothetical protein
MLYSHCSCSVTGLVGIDTSPQQDMWQITLDMEDTLRAAVWKSADFAAQ